MVLCSDLRPCRALGMMDEVQMMSIVARLNGKKYNGVCSPGLRAVARKMRTLPVRTTEGGEETCK